MSIFRKPKTGNIAPETLHTTPPIPSCKSPKKELPEPPFNATVARSYAHWKEEEAINIIKNKIWEDIKREVENGGVILNTDFDFRSHFTFGVVSDTERACTLLSSKLYKILIDFGVELVKMDYSVTVINDIYSDKYYDAINHKWGFCTSDNYSLDRVRMKIYWGELGNEQEPYLKTINHSGHLIRKLDTNNTEHFIRPERIFIKTKEELENGDKSDG